MKRLHVHISVADIDESVRFYRALFSAPPNVSKADYAKWMMDDPCVNFAISTRGAAAGLDHLGIQVETPEELREVQARMTAAGRPILEQAATTCCYAKSEKAWVTDPQNVAWETFLTSGESTVYGDDAQLGAIRTRGVAAAGPSAGQDVTEAKSQASLAP